MIASVLVDPQVFSWIESHLEPQPCFSSEFIYDDMESQSLGQLPIIYVPFDGGSTGHWRDRGAMWDFLTASGGLGQSILDFGPGDGWPSLLMAPFVREVTGVDASPKRVEVCCENALRLNLTNATFVHSPPGVDLPFADESFAGVTAAHSVEQSADPQATLRELHRVLKPGGSLRLAYESLTGYRGQERILWLTAVPRGTKVLLYNRALDEERVTQYALTLDLPPQEVTARLTMSSSTLTPDWLKILVRHIQQASVLVTHHPSGRTWVQWLRQAGFSHVQGTHSGADFAGRLHQQLGQPRLGSVEDVDAALQRVIPLVVDLPAPLELDPMITARK